MNLTGKIQNNSCLLISLLISIGLMLVPSFGGGEKQIYWFFSRVIVEHFEFQIADRSPLYSLWLIPFFKMGPLYGMYVEQFVGSFLGVYSLVLITRKSNPLFLVACLIGFILYARVSDPPVQWYGMACVNFGLHFFFQKKWFPSFMLFFIAYLLRSVYIFPLVFLVMYGLFLPERKIIVKSFLIAMMCVVSFLTLIQLNQSKHRLNNVYAGDAAYIPGGDARKSLFRGGLIQSMAWKYNEKNNILDSDFYFTHKTLFGDANTLLSMFKANSTVMIDAWKDNVKLFGQLLLGWLFLGSTLYRIASILVLIPILFGIYLLLNRRFLQKENLPSILFVLSSFPAIFVMVIFIAKSRLFVPMVPALWVLMDSLQLDKHLFTKSNEAIRSRADRTCRILAFAYVALCSVVLFKENITKEIRRPVELSQEIAWLNSNIDKYHCEKIIFAYDAGMYGAFLNNSIESVESFGILPPFQADVRLNCVVLTEGLLSSPGDWSTNSKLRYDLHLQKQFAENTVAKFNDLYFLVAK